MISDTSTLDAAAVLAAARRARAAENAAAAEVLEQVVAWSPHGHRYLRDHTGTTDLTPAAVDPPHRRAG